MGGYPAMNNITAGWQLAADAILRTKVLGVLGIPALFSAL